MTKTQFIGDLRADIDRFVTFWDKIVANAVEAASDDSKGAVRDAHERMTPAEWFEQFLMFCEMTEEERAEG